MVVELCGDKRGKYYPIRQLESTKSTSNGQYDELPSLGAWRIKLIRVAEILLCFSDLSLEIYLVVDPAWHVCPPRVQAVFQR